MDTGKPWKVNSRSHPVLAEAKPQAANDPPKFSMASIPAKWFPQYVREELIVELSKLMGTAEQPIPIEKWPNAEAIIVNTLHSNKAARVLRLFLKRYQERAFFFLLLLLFPFSSAKGACNH